jgi:rod shape determining protein RodA
MISTLLEPRLRKQIDYVLLGAVFLLLLVGLGAIYFAKFADSHDLSIRSVVVKQAIFFMTGIGIAGWVASRDYRNIAQAAPALYIINLALLFLVLFLGKHSEAKGSARWILLPFDFKLQPSEFAKITVILAVSSFVTVAGPRIKQLPMLLKSLVYVGLPFLLIAKQPDLGTALVVMAIWFGIVYIAGAQLKHLLALVGAAITIGLIAWFTPPMTIHGQKIGLQSYQRTRIEVLLDSNHDPKTMTQEKKDDAYQITQAKIAIGAGQATGQGLGEGIMTNRRKGIRNNKPVVPENHTDMIFTVIGEEAGFVGAIVLLCLYGIILFRGLATIADCEDTLGRLLATGVVTLLGFHVIVNIGMNCAIFPVVGVPLPLVSYGGSASWANLTAIGILISVHLRRRKILF